MGAAADRQSGGLRRRGRGRAAIFTVLAALSVAGCGAATGVGGGGNGSGGNVAGGSGANVTGGSAGGGGTAPLVTGEQVVTSCFQAYFYNGILPKASARANCTSCVVDQLRKLGIQPPSGETVMDMLTGERLSGADIRTLQGRCGVSDGGSP